MLTCLGCNFHVKLLSFQILAFDHHEVIMSQAPEAEEKPKSAKSGFGDDAKSVRSNKSAVSIRTAISVTLPTTAKGGAGASVEKRNMSTGDTRDATFPLDEPVPPVGTPTQTEAKKQKYVEWFR